MTKGERLVFRDDLIYIESKPNQYVMMEWETELMKKHAEVVCSRGGDILEIGFGMGIFSTFVQGYNINSHTIVESHPQIYERLLEWSKKYDNVKIIFGDWYRLSWKINLNKYNGIFYDADCKNFPFVREKIVDKSIKKGGIFSYFSPDNLDTYNYKERLNFSVVNIDCEIPKNPYHNQNICYYNWINY